MLVRFFHSYEHVCLSLFDCCCTYMTFLMSLFDCAHGLQIWCLLSCPEALQPALDCMFLSTLDFELSPYGRVKLDFFPLLKITVPPYWSLAEPGFAVLNHMGFKTECSDGAAVIVIYFSWLFFPQFSFCLAFPIPLFLISFSLPFPVTCFLSLENHPCHEFTYAFFFLPPFTFCPCVAVCTISVFLFQTTMVSLEGLSKVVDPSQLTPDFEGSLDYNHEEWIEIRVAFEDFTGNARHLLSRLEEMQDTVTRKDFPQDLDGARRMIEEHAALKKKVMKAPVEEVDTEGQRLLQRIQSSDSYANRTVPVGPGQREGQGQPNADTQGLVPRISALLEQLHSTRQNLHQAWHVRKLQLDQCFQLRLFEQDAEKVRHSHCCMPDGLDLLLVHHYSRDACMLVCICLVLKVKGWSS